jgi:DNA-binding Lrp family transcriptional regulator
MALKLTEIDRQVLALIELNADRDAASIASTLGKQIHTVHYTIRRLVERGILGRKHPIVDGFRTGFESFSIYFSLVATEQKEREALLQSLAQFPGVLWFSELAGRFQYAAQLAGRSSLVAQNFMQATTKRKAVARIERAFAIRTSFHIFPRSYFFRGARLNEVQTFRAVVEIEPLDDLDRRILQGMSATPYTSQRNLALQLQEASATIDRRIARLRQRRILRGFLWSVNLQSVGVQKHKLLLFCHGAMPSFAKELFDFCSEHPSIVNLAECLGSWDFEINAELQSAAELSLLLAQLHERFASEIQRIESMMVLKYRKFQMFPG